MGKKKTRLDTSGPAALSHSPFAALAGASLPEGPPKVEGESVEPRPSPTSRFAKKVVVRREKKGRGGKTVTRIEGVLADARDDVAAQLKRALGCGATVEGEDVIVLGDVGDRAADWLEEEGARRVVRGS